MTNSRPTSFVTYIRVSTARQGASGLGLEAQRESVRQYLGGRAVLREFVEIESGRRADRPELMKALALAKSKGAVLLVAKLDRLSRSVAFVSALMEAGVKFKACDMPEADEFTVNILAAVARREARLISERTRDALAAAKRRGVELGATGPANLKRNLEERKAAANAFAERLRREIRGMQAEEMTVAAMVRELNEKGITSARGGQWQSVQLGRVIARLDAEDLTGREALRGSW